MRNHKGQIPGRISTDFWQKPQGFMNLKPRLIFNRLDAIDKFIKKVVSGINPGCIWTFWQSLGDFEIPSHLRTMDLINKSIRRYSQVSLAALYRTVWQSLRDFKIPGHLRTKDLINSKSTKKVVSGFPGCFVPDFLTEPWGFQDPQPSKNNKLN